MNLTIRSRLTLFFTLLFAFLLVLSLGTLYRKMSKSFRKDFRAEMVHDGRIIAELFKEELKLNALEEFEKEIKEFGIELQVLNEKKEVVVQSEGWPKTDVVIDDGILASIQESPLFKEIKVDKKPFALFSRPIHIPSRGRYSLHIVRSQKALTKMSGKLLHWILIITPFMIILGAIAGYFFSANALASVEKIRKKADSIYAEDLSARLPIPAQKDELYYLTETLNRMLDRIQSSFERLKNFTADASHELRAPLTALRGNLEVALRKDRAPQEYKEAIKDALEEAENLSRLTQDLLLLAQTDAGQLNLNIQDMQIRNFLEDVFSESQSLLNENSVKMTLKPPPEGEIWFDPDRIRQLLLNLIDNALKYSRPGGEMNLSAQFMNGSLQLIVQDTGIGIPQGDLEKIFDRFYRVDKSRSRQQGGTGLGLSISRWIAEAHRGHIKVESREGQGTTFTVTLPMNLSAPTV